MDVYSDLNILCVSADTGNYGDMERVVEMPNNGGESEQNRYVWRVIWFKKILKQGLIP